MTWWAVGAAAVGVIGGAISSKQQADAANKPRTQVTNQTTTQQGNYANELQPDFRQAMQLMRANMEGGPRYIPGGHVDYAGQAWPNGGHAGGPGPAVEPPGPAGGQTFDPKTWTPPPGPITPGTTVPPDNQVGVVSESIPSGSSWFPPDDRTDSGAGPREIGGLPEGATRRPDGRVILASGETQGMTKADRHRAWMDWKRQHAGMGA